MCTAVIAAADDPEGAILGSAVAAGLRVPLLLCERDQPGEGVEAALKGLSVARVLVAVSDVKNRPRWIDKLEVPSEIMSPRVLEHRLVNALGRDKIRNVVVARAPDTRADVGRSARACALHEFRTRLGGGSRSRKCRRGGRGRRAAVDRVRVAFRADRDHPRRLHFDRIPRRGSRSQRQ